LKLFRSIHKGVFRMIGKGENFFHMVYIDDLVKGILLAGEKVEAIGEVFILCGETPVHLKDLVHLIAKILGRPTPRGSIPVWPVMQAARLAKAVLPRLGIDPPIYPRRLDFFLSSRWFSIEKARKVLGYQPRVDLPIGLTHVFNWYQQNSLL
jgi:nucleoside-diphosphate-sugar epimerase